MRSLRRPKHTVHPARRSRMSETNVNQKPYIHYTCQIRKSTEMKWKKHTGSRVCGGVKAWDFSDFVVKECI